jgi:hypothetical protein
MPRVALSLALAVALLALITNLPLHSQQPPASASGHYLFAWAGDAKHQGMDFLAVIDADPNSPSYGHLITSVATDQKTMQVHHTEYLMPPSGMLFANDHLAGRTFIFDVRDALHPKVVTSVTGLGGYMHPHSYIRLPNGHVLATFQHKHGEPEGQMGGTGGLVEIDDAGTLIRSASSADPAFAGALLAPYGLVILPHLDRIVTTNSSMHQVNIFSGVTYQVWRLSDLKLLKTSFLDVGANRYAHVSPEEPRLGPDGAVYVQTLGCGIERITGVDTPEPKSKLVYTFPGSFCGVPTIVGHFLIQSVPVMNGLIALDISNGEKPVEVSRLALADEYSSHWTGWDAKTHRLVVTASDTRLFLVNLDESTGALAVDSAFHDDAGKPGFEMADRDWPHAWHGSAVPHGAVFSR